MQRIKQFNQWVLATHNAGKLAEMQAILAHLPVRLISQSELDITSVAETGQTFVENAIIKARHATKASGLPALADDSGLIVDALNGAPGIYSARYAGDNATATQCNEALLTALQDVPLAQRTAHYYCVIVLLATADDPEPVICQGRWHGRIALEPRGQHGFGYDPIFYLADLNCHVAELNPSIKNQLSHRVRALQKLQQLLIQDTP